eukprot:COSAG01_NODE_71408_length_256_cov_0.585987_1_plen_49_part_01
MDLTRRTVNLVGFIVYTDCDERRIVALSEGVGLRRLYSANLCMRVVADS